MAVDIKRPVVIKAKMTDEFRKHLISEAMGTISNIEENLKQLEQQGRGEVAALELTNPQQAKALSQNLEAEKEQLHRMKRELEWKIKEVEGVPTGSEMPFRILEGSTTLQVGDNFLEKMSQAEVVIQDWKVITIRT